MKDILEWVLKLKVIPQGWLTVLGGFGTLLIGAGNLVCAYTGACEHQFTAEASLAMVTAGAGLIGLGRRKG